MAQIDFSYTDIKPLSVPDENLLGIFSPVNVQAGQDEGKLIDDAFLHPVGSAPLQDAVRGSKNILVVVDDFTRQTPVSTILPRLIKELEEGGVNAGNVKIMVALGTHRPMTAVEMEAKFGKDICARYPVLNHEWWDKSRLISLGDTPAGTPIVVNRIVREVDFIIGIGQIVPHRVSGFSGGGNIIQPGICGEITTGKTHWLAARFTGREILGKAENPVKREIEAVAVKAGLRWIVNTIQDGKGDLAAVVAGDPLEAYRAGTVKSAGIYRALLPSEADIVIADSRPYDNDLWLASKGIYAAELAVRQRGVVILISPCPEGVSPSHPEVLEAGYGTFNEVEEKVLAGAAIKLTAAAHLVHVGRVIKERARGILVSRGITEKESMKLGFIYAREPEEALDIAFSILGRRATVAILRRGGEILPDVKEVI